MFVKKGSKLSYTDFLNNIQNKAYWIRHDVDIDLSHSLEFAKFEARSGIFATYFLLHTNPYFDYSDKFGKMVEEICSLGHTIGFHNDILSVWWTNKSKNILDLLNKPLTFLRKFSEIKGTSCHGNASHYEKKYINYQVWKEYNFEKITGMEIKWPQLSYKEVGLEYEAYFLPFTHYFSDSGNNAIGYVVDGFKMFEKEALFSKRNIGFKVVDEFNKSNSGFLQILVHPEHWVKV